MTAGVRLSSRGSRFKKIRRGRGPFWRADENHRCENHERMETPREEESGQRACIAASGMNNAYTVIDLIARIEQIIWRVWVEPRPSQPDYLSMREKGGKSSAPAFGIGESSLSPRKDFCKTYPIAAAAGIGGPTHITE